MNLQQAIKELNEITNVLARLTEGTELYASYKAKHVEAKKLFNELVLAQAVLKMENGEELSSVEKMYIMAKAEEVKEIEEEIELTVNKIESRKNDFISKSGVSTNSIIAGFANGSISLSSDIENQKIYSLKQSLMSGGVYTRYAAKLRNQQRVKNRMNRGML